MKDGFKSSVGSVLYVENQAGNLIVTIPTVRNWLIISFLVFWLGGWSVGGWKAASSLHSDTAMISEVWHSASWIFTWITAELAITGILIRQIHGIDEILVSRFELTVINRALVTYKKRTFKFAQINKLRWESYGKQSDGTSVNVGSLVFGSSSEPVMLLDGLSKSESDYVLGLLSNRLPRKVFNDE